MSRFGRSEFLRIDRAARTASWRCCSLVRGLPRRERRSHAIEANAMTVAIARTVHPYVGMNQFYELVASDLTCGRSVVCSEFLYLVKGGPSARRRVSAGPRVRPGGRSRPGARGAPSNGRHNRPPTPTPTARRTVEDTRLTGSVALRRRGGHRRGTALEMPRQRATGKKPGRGAVSAVRGRTTPCAGWDCGLGWVKPWHLGGRRWPSWTG